MSPTCCHLHHSALLIIHLSTNRRRGWACTSPYEPCPGAALRFGRGHSPRGDHVTTRHDPLSVGVYVSTLRAGRFGILCGAALHLKDYAGDTPRVKSVG